MARIAPVLAALVLVMLATPLPAQTDPASRARAECEAKLQIPQIAGTGDPVREQQLSACVQQKLRESPAPQERRPRR